MVQTRLGKPDPYDLHPTPATFTLTSSDITDGGAMPAAQVDTSVGGGGTSPQLSWSGFPEGTKSFIVTAFDPDAPTMSGFWHWVVGPLPADCTSLPAGAGAPGYADLPEGAVQLRNDGGVNGYMGAAPPAGDGPHRYIFAVHSFDDEVELEPDQSCARASFMANLQGTARATLMVTHEETQG